MTRKNISVAGILGLACVLGITAAGCVSFLHHQSDQDQNPAGDSDTPTQTSQNGEVRLNASQIQTAGIRSERLQTVSGRIETQAVAVVLSPQELLDLRSNYLSDVSQVQKAKAALQASQAEYERLRDLNRDDKTASDKSVEAAEAAYKTDLDSLHSAQSALTLASFNVTQHWGGRIERWFETDASVLKEVLQAKQVLVEVTLPQTAAPPARFAVTSNGRNIRATFVSELPRLDARFQNPSYLYLAPANQVLVPGANVVSQVPAGHDLTGLLLPDDAVIHREGSDWIYVQTGQGTFQREQVQLDERFRGGWLIRPDTWKNDPVVTRGAEQLLSQEFQGVTKQAGDED